MNENFAAIILSAGYSSRMKAFKPLLKLGDKNALEHAVNNFLAVDIKEIIVVAGYRFDVVRNNCSWNKCRCVYNDKFADGMYSSVKKGIISLNSSIDAFFLLPVDIPLIRSSTLLFLIENFKNYNKKIIHPTLNGVRGHPPLISGDYIPDIIKFNGDGGLKKVLDRFESDSLDVPVCDRGILLDMDTKIDYKILQKYYKNYDYPDKMEAEAILNKYCNNEKIVQHSKKVQEAAVIIGRAINEENNILNLDLIESSALLHDIKKGEKNHAAEGAKLLKELSFPAAAEIVGSHMDIQPSRERITEKEVVYYSDKIVKEDKFITLEERFKDSFDKFEGNKNILEHVKRKFDNAKFIENKLKKYDIDLLNNIY